MGILFTIFYQPVANTLFALMSVMGTNSIVLGILALIVVVKLILLPSSIKNSETQRKMSGISGKLKDIKENIKDKKEQAEKTMEVYRSAGINPLSPILLLLFQIPFFITIFFVTRDLGDGLFEYGEVLYSFISKPEIIDFSFLFMNTTENGGVYLAISIMVSQIVLMLFSQKRMDNSSKNAKIIMFVLPAIIGLFSLSIVATVGLYWLFNNLLSIPQEVYIRSIKKEEDESSHLQNTESIESQKTDSEEKN